MAQNKGPSISIAADTKDAQRGIKDGIIEPLEDARDVLADLATDSKKLDKLEDGMQDAARETADMRDELDKLNRSVRETASAGRNLGDDWKRGTQAAGEGVSELKDEANSTAREAAASFDGSAESIVDAFQEVAANAFAGFGPAGAIAGLAAAAGIGMVVKTFQEGEVRSEALREKISALTDALIEAGARGEIPIQFIVDNLRELASISDEGETSLADLADMAEKTGNNFGQLAQYFAGNVDGIDAIIESQRELNDEYDRGQALGDARMGQIDEENTAREDIVKKLQETKQAAEDARVAEEAWIAAGGPQLEMRAAQIDMVNQAYDDAAGNVDAFISEETGLFDVTAYITAMQQREKALADYQTKLATSGLSDEAKAFLNEQGAEAAATMLAGYQSGDQATRNELNRIWTEAGKEGSGAADKVIKETFKTPYEAKVEVDLDKTKADKDIAEILKRRQLEVMVTYVGRDGRPVD